VYVINNNLTGIHKKSSAASFADFIEEFNSELIFSIEQSARKVGTFIYIFTLLLLSLTIFIKL